MKELRGTPAPRWFLRDEAMEPQYVPMTYKYASRARPPETDKPTSQHPPLNHLRGNNQS